MHKYLIKLYNWKPLNLLSTAKITFFLHPAVWRFGISKKSIDLGPLAIEFPLNRQRYWVFDEVEQRLYFDLTPEHQKKFKAEFESLLVKMLDEGYYDGEKKDKPHLSVVKDELH